MFKIRLLNSDSCSDLLFLLLIEERLLIRSVALGGVENKS